MVLQMQFDDSSETPTPTFRVTHGTGDRPITSASTVAMASSVDLTKSALILHRAEAVPSASGFLPYFVEPVNASCSVDQLLLSVKNGWQAEQI